MERKKCWLRLNAYFQQNGMLIVCLALLLATASDRRNLVHATIEQEGWQYVDTYSNGSWLSDEQVLEAPLHVGHHWSTLGNPSGRLRSDPGTELYTYTLANSRQVLKVWSRPDGIITSVVMPLGYNRPGSVPQPVSAIGLMMQGQAPYTESNAEPLPVPPAPMPGGNLEQFDACMRQIGG